MLWRIFHDVDKKQKARKKKKQKKSLVGAAKESNFDLGGLVGLSQWQFILSTLIHKKNFSTTSEYHKLLLNQLPLYGEKDEK